jgi:hypothetical protein
MNDNVKRSQIAIARWALALAFAAAAQVPVAAQEVDANRLRFAAQPQPAAEPQMAPAEAPAEAPAAPVAATFKLTSLSAAEFEGRLFAIWSQRAQATQDLATQTASFRLPAGAAGEIVIHIDRRTAQVTVTAPQPTAPSWLNLIKSVDVRRPAGSRLAVVPVTKADPVTINRTISLLKAASALGNSRNKKRHIGQFVSTIFQPEGAPPPPPDAGGAPPGAEGAPGEAAAGGDPFAGIGNVRIEILDDQIIVIGSKEDVEKVLAIIEDIERQSLETLPEVEIYYLKYVDGQALNALITQVYTLAIGALGTVLSRRWSTERPDDHRPQGCDPADDRADPEAGQARRATVADQGVQAAAHVGDRCRADDPPVLRRSTWPDDKYPHRPRRAGAGHRRIPRQYADRASRPARHAGDHPAG